MKKHLFLPILLFTLFTTKFFAQSDSSTYVSGDLSTQFDFTPTVADNSYGCTDTLVVTIPAGNYVTSVDVYYSIEALGGSWVSQQSSYIECLSTGNKETAITVGDALWDSIGVANYQRTGLNIADGMSVTGELQFYLHSFRTNGFFPLCGNTDQSIPDSSWKVVVHHIPAPSCFPPTSITSSARTSTSLTIDWVTGGASNWQLEYGLSGFTPGSGTVVGVTTNPVTLNSLLPETSYDVRLRDSCGVGNVSIWSGFETFTTACSAQSLPYAEDFNIDEGCFTILDGGTSTDSWLHTINGGQNLNGTGYMRVDSDAFGLGETLDETLESPEINAAGITGQLFLEFDHFFQSIGQDTGEVDIWDGSAWVNVYTVTNTIGGWNNPNTQSIDITTYANANLKVRFRYTDNGGWAWFWSIDNFEVKTLSCLDPSILGVNSVTTQAAEVFWTTGGASNWNIEYGPTGFTPGSGSILIATNDTTTITALSAGSCFDFYVQDSCAPGDVSAWIGPFTFCTLCNPTTAPWTENFDNANWVSGAGALNAGNVVDVCWTRPNADNPNFSTRSGATTTGASGPSADFSGAGNYLYTESSNGANGPGEVNTPPIIIPNSMTTPMLEFYYHMFGNTVTSLEVQIDNGNGFGASVITLTGQQQAASADPWLSDTLHLTAFKGDTITIKFIGTNTGFTGDIAIDEVSIQEAPTCTDPSNLGVVDIAQQGANVFWTTGGASMWNVEYGLQGYLQGNGTVINATNDTTPLSGLNPGTCYDFYVRDSCGPNSSGNWVGPFSFCTLCNATVAPWSENFDGANWVSGVGAPNTGNVIDICWTRPDETNPNFGTRAGGTGSFGTGPNGDFSGAGNYLYTEASGSAGTGEIISIPIVIPNSMVAPQLEFYYHMAGLSVVSLDIEIDNGSGFGTVAKSIVGTQQNASNDPWLSDTLDLTNYIGDTIRIKFLATNNGFQADIAIDELSIDEAPTCNDPIDLGLDAAFANSASVFWTSGGATNWNIEYGAQGFTQGSGTLLSSPSDTTKITGLTASTCYDFYVRDSCGPGDVSNWAGPFTFCTLCTPVSTPYTENFDGAIWTTGANNTDLGTIDACWVRTPQTIFTWKAGPPPNLSGLTGPSTDHTTGTGGFIYSERIGFFGPNTGTIDAFAQTPPIIITGLTNPALSFWYHMYGNSVVEMEVDINNGSGWTSLYTRIGQQQTSGTDAWKEAIVNLSSYIGDTVIVRFSSTNNNGGTNNDVSIDDVEIDEAPSCPKPQDLQVIGSTNTSVTLGWISGGSANWNIEYGAPGFTQGSGTIVAATTNPFTLGGLSPNTSYEFYVQDSCGLGDVSNWIGSVSALTDCNPVTAPLIENFDGASWVIGVNQPGTLAACWRTNPDTGFAFTPGQNGTPSNNTGPSVDHTSGNGKFVYAETYYNFTGFNPNQTVLSTPLVDVTPLTNPELKFYYHMFGGDITSLQVRVFDGSSWTSVATYTGAQQSGSPDPWLEAVIDLIAFAGDTIKVEFIALKAVGVSIAADMAIDDLSIDEKPACSKPSNLVSSNATATSIDLSWTSGGATLWEIEYGPAGFTLGQGTIIAATTNPFTVPGLSPSTTYEFYVRDSCGVGNVSLWTGPILDNTLCNAVSAPYTENFDGPNFDPGANGFGVPGTVDACWNRIQTATYFWKAGPSTPQTGGTGPSADHTTGSGGYLFTESGGFAQPPLAAEIETPEIDLSALTTPELTFWYHMFGPNVGSLEVEISNDGGFSWTSLQTITGAQQTSQAAAWIESIVDISSYANDTVIVRFTGDKTTFGNQSDIAIDDIGIDEAPACPKSTGLQVTSISATEATLSWTAGGGSAWWVEYGPVGFTPGFGTTVSTPTNPFTVTGLMANTGYEFYVIDSCNAFAISDQSIPVADTTECNLFVAPFMENFDGSSFLVGGSINNPGAIDGCWERTFANSYFWSVEQNGTVSANTGPSADHTTGAGKFMFTDGFGQPQQTELISPQIDLTALNAPELRFWYHMYGATIDRMEVEVWNGNSWNNEFTLTGQQQNANTDPWSEAVVNLSSYLGDTVQVRFVGFRQGNQTANDMALDDVWIGDSTACARPDSATLITATTNSITIQWNNYSGIGSVVQYRPAGSTSPFIQQTTTGGTATLSGLSPSTTYEIFIKDSCGVGNTSLWTSGYLFSTLCGTLTAPWSENFDGAGWFPGSGNDNNNDQISACWFRSTNTGTRWGTGTGGTNSGQTGPSGDFNGGGQYIYTEATIGTGRSTIESPFILLPTLLAQPTLEYYYHMFGAGIDSMYVRIDNGSGFVTRKIYLGQQQNANGAAWLSDTIDLTSFIGDSVQIQFVGVNSNFQGDIAIDQVSITGQIITCGDPTAISFSNIGNTSAIINWTSNSGTSELEVVPTGQAQGTGTLYTPVTSPFTATGLSPLTSYDVYIRDVCGTQLSNWEDSTFTTTACPAVSVLFNSNDNLLNVSFNGSASTGADTLSWTFGDGNTAIGANVNNVYTNPGTYTITLIGYNACGNADTATQTITICDSLVADFSLVQTGDTILFNGSSSFGASNYRWDFGDGNDTTGIVSGLHQYAASGVFTVTLTVYNDCGDSISITKTAQSCGPPRAIWSFTVLSTTSAGMLVQFDGSTSLNGNTFSWDFGDGNTNTTSAIPQHTYLIPSLQYTVSLTVTNLCGDSHNLSSRMDRISIPELQVEDRRIEVYPNPADEEVYIELIDGEKIEDAVLGIYEVGGKKIFEKEISIEESQQKVIDVKNLPPGHYTLELKTDEYRQHYPLIIR